MDVAAGDPVLLCSASPQDHTLICPRFLGSWVLAAHRESVSRELPSADGTSLSGRLPAPPLPHTPLPGSPQQRLSANSTASLLRCGSCSRVFSVDQARLYLKSYACLTLSPSLFCLTTSLVGFSRETSLSESQESEGLSRALLLGNQT